MIQGDLVNTLTKDIGFEETVPRSISLMASVRLTPRFIVSVF